MSRRTPLDHRSGVVPRAPDGRRARVGPHVGPVRVTPARVSLTLALGGGLGFLAYAIVVRDQLQVPLMASGFAITGLALAAVAVMAVAGIVRAGREGRDAAALVNALLGGLVAVASLMAFAAAIVMALIWGSTD